jgi:putative ABC transport system ATP-binding protein
MKPLEVQNVTKVFRQGERAVTALNGVSLSVSPGQFLAIMGASGSGKSTLLHVMAALTLPDAGTVLVNGRDLRRMNDRELTIFRRRHIGLVFQAFNLIPTLTAAENLVLPLLLDGHSRSQAEPKGRQLLERLGLAHRAGHRPDVLSGGEQQRVAIGRALIAEPAVILADEPTGNLDSVSSRGICELLRDLSQKQGKTIVMVTHEPAVAAYAQDVAVMKDGCIIQQFATADAGNGQNLALKYQECVR